MKMVKDYIGNNNIPLGNVHKNKAKYVHKIGCVWVCESQKSCMYTGGKGPSSLL